MSGGAYFALLLAQGWQEGVNLVSLPDPGGGGRILAHQMGSVKFGVKGDWGGAA